MIAGWDGQAATSPTTSGRSTRAPDGKQYYLPLQYVVIYLYYRQDLFQQAGLQPPKTFDEFLAAAKALTKDDIVRLRHARRRRRLRQLGSVRARRRRELREGRHGDRKGAGGEPLVSSSSPREAKGHARLPRRPTASARSSTAFKAGRTAMTIHHVGSANEMVGGARRQGLGRSGAARAPTAGLDLFRRRIQCRLCRQQGQGGGVPLDRLPVHRREQHRAQTSSADSCRSPPRRLQGLDRASQARSSMRAPPRCRSPARCRISRRRRTSSPAIWPTNMQRALTGEISSGRHDEGHRTASSTDERREAQSGDNRAAATPRVPAA